MKSQLIICCDFDGTVTRQDTLVEILNRFGDPAWHDIQRKVVSGELSIREGLKLEMDSVRATLEELKELLVARVELEPSFLPFLQAIRAKGIPLILLSGGFDLCVETLLAKMNLTHLPFLANRLIRNNGVWHIDFPYESSGCSACGHCKADPIRNWNAQGYTTVFVGNGVTDRCAASAAKLTFAKSEDELLKWCQANRIVALPYRSFNDVEQELTRRGWL